MTPSEVSAHAVQECGLAKDHHTSPRILRTLEIEEASNRYGVHRISLAILPALVRVGATPNLVSCMGALSGFAAAWSYLHYENPWACLLGFVLMVGWHVFDGADGQLARHTGQTSQAGFVIDGVCDYLTFIFVYGALGYSLSTTMGPGIWALVFGAALSHAVQAAAFEMQRETYVAWISSQPLRQRRQSVSGPGSEGLSQCLAAIYHAIQNPFRPLSMTIEEDVLSGEDRKQHFDTSDAYRLAFRRTVLAWSILSANNRTIAIFLFCLSGNPLLYFMYELVALNLVLAALVLKNHASRRAFVQALT